MRPLEMFTNEIELQNAAAKGGFTCPVIAHAIEMLDKKIYGREPQQKKKFMTLAMPRMDFSLEDQMSKYLFLDVNAMRKLTAQMLMGLRDIHYLGFVHCDLKPANIMFKTTVPKWAYRDMNGFVEPSHIKSQLQFIDFGLAEKFTKNKSATSMRFQPKGTPNYMSRNCHEGRPLTRRDDLESVVYIVIKCINSSLPWQNMKPTKDTPMNKLLLEMKEKYWGPKLSEGLPAEFQELVKTITEMEADEEPPYQRLIDLMLDFSMNEGISIEPDQL